MITWGSFGVIHMMTIILAIGVITLLYFLLRRCSSRTQMLVLGILSFSGVAAILFNLFAWDSPLEYLPLHLCSLTALLLPITVFTRSQRLGNLLLLWSLGAILAIVVNMAQADYSLFSWTFFFYYFPHALQFGIPILLIRLGLIRKDPRWIGSTLGITAGAYTLVHLCNQLINSRMAAIGSDVRVNYIYSIEPANPVLELLYSAFPHPYWYMYLTLPLILVYLALVYLPELRALWAARRHQAQV